jgi:hypothetical protein
MESGGGGDDQLHGLKFGKKIYFEDAAGSSSGSSSGGGSAPAPPATQQPSPPAASPRAPAGGGRRGRAAAGGAGPSTAPAPARCQVDGCNVDLTDVKPAYYCRHKVCKMHSKEPRVLVNGLEQRFCQQCSRSPPSPAPPLLHSCTPPLFHLHLSFNCLFPVVTCWLHSLCSPVFFFPFQLPSFTV